MPEIDFIAVSTPRFTRPELLRHSTIPRPMSGMAPRVVMGEEWWDKIRREAYGKNNMRCFACGGSGPLEAHEAYDINHYTMRMVYLETVALCKDCHSFIHIGRTVSMVAQSLMDPGDAKRVVMSGYETLRRAGLKCPWETRVIVSERLPWRGSTEWIKRVLAHCDPIPHLPMTEWADWRLVFNSREYPPLFSSYEGYERSFK